jgi:glc operon protein GlcG
MTLTLADANRVIAGAIAKAAEIGAKMNIAVCDAGGRLVAFQRMDGAMWAGSYGSQGKAVASAAFGRPSGDLTPRADHPTLRGIVMAERNHMFLGQGRCRSSAVTCPWRLRRWWWLGSGGRGLRPWGVECLK